MDVCLKQSTAGSPEKNLTSRWPAVLCALTTTVAVPAWFLGLVAIRLNQGPVDNPMGIPIWLLLGLIFAIPTGILNAFVIAPALARFAAARSWWGAPITVHLAILLVSAGVLIGWIMLAEVIRVLQFTGLLVGPCIFLGPPVIAGSVVYSILDRRSAARRGRS